MTVVCGDSHTSTNGAFAALAFGIGTSEVEHVLATQTSRRRSRSRCSCAARARFPRASRRRTSVLAIIGKIGTAGGTGYAIEFGGSTMRALSMEGA
jgi:3-isopropylmalate/(R)-2-methylmalate dehydratase large subunit